MLIATFVVVLIVFLLWLLVWRFEEYTTDSYVQGNMVTIKPLRYGFVTGIFTDDSFAVKKGQILISLDKTDAEIALEKAKQKLAQTVREICQSYHNVFVLAADIRIKEAQELKARQNLKHRQGVIRLKGISLEDYQNAVDDFNASKAAVDSTKNSFKKALAWVQGSSITQHPAVQAAVQKLRDAWVQLYRCTIYAPVDGIVAQRTIQVGMSVTPNDALMSVIPMDQIWVNANFKETQMKYMRIGQPVRMTADLYGNAVVYHGTIVGLPGAAGNVFALLPPENLSGNWIKIVQRLPVRVRLRPEEVSQFPLRVGLTMTARVDISNTDGPYMNTPAVIGPRYETSIFNQEEVGVDQLINQIIAQNLDPSLLQFAAQELNPKILAPWSARQ